MFVRAVVIQDEVEFQFGRKLGIDGAQKFEELLMAVARQALSDHFAIQHIERRKQGRGAVADIVMGVRAATPLLERQTGLGAVERLDLALFIDTKHDRLIGRIEVDPHYICELLDKAFVARKLESPLLMRLETVQVPDSLHGFETDSFSLGHRATTPMSLARWLGMLGGGHQSADFLPANLPLASATGGDAGESLRASL